MSLPCCGRCRFQALVDITNVITGPTGGVTRVCRRFPPVPAMVQFSPGMAGAVSNFPPVGDGDWCGEFRPREGGAG